MLSSLILRISGCQLRLLARTTDPRVQPAASTDGSAFEQSESLHVMVSLLALSPAVLCLTAEHEADGSRSVRIYNSLISHQSLSAAIRFAQPGRSTTIARNEVEADYRAIARRSWKDRLFAPRALHRHRPVASSLCAPRTMILHITRRTSLPSITNRRGPRQILNLVIWSLCHRRPRMY